jgi:nicotinamide-nucleotide amidase
MLSQAATRLRECVGRSIYGQNDADLAAVVLDLCRSRGLTIGVAESCSGGLLGARLTAIPGSSDVVFGGVISYSNEMKTRLLGVEDAVLRAHGAVSEPVVRQMARGARSAAKSDIGLAITGVAGPGGGTPEKPVGMVWIAIDVQGEVTTRELRLWGDRDEVRQRSAQWTLELLRHALT